MNTVPGDEDVNNVPGDESESLSDIDDVEVVGYLHNKEERRYKAILWEQMNKEYIEEQALKEAAAAAAAKKVRETQFENCSEELAEATQAAVAKSRKEKQRKKAAAAKNMTPPQTVQEATRRELVKKRLSSKINFDAFELFDDSVSENNTKKARTDDPGAHIVDSNVNEVVPEEDDEEGYSGTTYDGADDTYNKYGYGDDDGFEDYGYEF